MTPPIEHYQNQAVRDLAWAIATPPLVRLHGGLCDWPGAEWYVQQYRLAESWLKELDDSPAALETLLEGQKDRRLGRYFETLWAYWLANHPDYELLAQNLQVVIDGETLGELDFIVRDRRSDQVIHIEVAVKFYLGIGDTRVMSNWHGPGLKDRLDRKVTHLQHRQTSISQDPAVRRWLGAQGFAIDGCRVILKGRLYYPAHQFPEDSIYSNAGSAALDDHAPQNAAAGHLRSWWYRKSDFVLNSNDKDRFCALIKQGWLQRIPTRNLAKNLSISDLFQNKSSDFYRLPLHIQSCSPHHIWDRAFITQDDWGLEKS